MMLARVMWMAAVVALSAVSVDAATPEQVQAAIKKATEYLYSQQTNGNWETKPRDPTGKGNDHHGGQWGGRTAIATYALLAAGESHQDPRIRQAIEFLKKEEIVGTYALGLRMQVWYFLPQTPEIRSLVARDARMLMNSVHPPGSKNEEARGHYGYVPGTGEYSHSRSQYAVLGIWAAAQMNFEVPTKYWQYVEPAWLRNQDPSGGWSYQHPKEDKHPPTPGMTAAGVASLYIIQDYLYSSRGLDCKPGKTFASDASIEAGMKWLASNSDKFLNSKSHFGSRDFPLTTAYAIERIGVASGRKYIGDVDWFEKGAEWMVSIQKPDGSFPSDHSAVQVMPSTCFAVLFLARGGAPILMNKLEYANEGEKNPDWNNRPRDVANVARWVGRQYEREYNWQVVGFQAKPADWHDAPILYISGNEPLNLKEEDKQKLKRYIEQGGLIFGHADCSSRSFTQSFQKLGTELFPNQEFRVLPEDHIIYTNRFRRSQWKSKPQVVGLSNGVRELMLLVTNGDPGRDWQTLNTVGGNESSWELAANIYYYAAEGTSRSMRGMTHWVEPDEKLKPTQTIAVSRLIVGPNADPEPGGWQRLGAYLNNRYKVGLDVKPVKAGEPIAGKVAHLTGTTAIEVDSAQADVLRKFIEGGGTLVIDAAGGSGAFATSAEALIAQLYPGQELSAIEEDHALFKAASESEIPITYRTHTRKALGSMPKTPRLKGIKVGERYGIIYSREDLSAGLVGQDVDGIAGYNPAAATRLMTQILFHATGTKAEVVKPEPAKKEPAKKEDAKKEAPKKEPAKK